MRGGSLLRRSFLRTGLAGAAATSGFAGRLVAQADYPSQRITLVNPFAPGSPVDFVARLLADQLRPALGGDVPLLVESRVGAGGTLGTGYVARSAPDGYTLLVATSSVVTVAPFLYKSLAYRGPEDFRPIWYLASAGLVMIVNPAVPARTLSEFVSYVRASPGKVSYGSAGRGSPQHLAAELFKIRTGVDLVHVPYRGAVPALNDLLGGQIQVMIDSVANILPHVQSGGIRPLATFRPKRAAALPDVPTAAEAGVSGVDMPGAIALLAPRGTPEAAVNRLTPSAIRVMQTPQVEERLLAAGNGKDMLSGEAVAAQLLAERSYFQGVISAIGLQPE